MPITPINPQVEFVVTVYLRDTERARDVLSFEAFRATDPTAAQNYCADFNGLPHRDRPPLVARVIEAYLLLHVSDPLQTAVDVRAMVTIEVLP